MLKFLFIVNKRGQPRIRKYYQDQSSHMKNEQEIIRSCLTRDDRMCNFYDFRDIRIIFRKYSSLWFIIGASQDENELSVWEFMQNIMETLNEYLKRVSELDLMMNVDRVYMILDEMISSSGRIIESNRSRILAPIYALDQTVRTTAAR